MGAVKAALRLGETTLVARALAATGGRRTAVILPAALADTVPAAASISSSSTRSPSAA
jgi:hypothetical protein